MERNKILVDSCVWIAFYDETDRQHIKAVKFFRRANNGNNVFVMHHLVIIETLSILKYKRFKPEILKKIKSHIFGSIETEIIKGSELNLSKKMWGWFEKVNRLGLVDVILLDHCLKNKMELTTFDKEMGEVWDKLKGRG